VRLLKYGIVAAVFAIIAMILLGVAMTMPWYEIRWLYEPEDPEIELPDAELSIEFTFNDATIRSEIDDPDYEDYKETIDYDEDEEAEDVNATIAAFRNTQSITIIAIILTLIFVVCALVVGLKKGKLATFALIVGILAFVAALLAPIYLMFGLPSAFKEDSEESGYFLDDEDAGYTDSFFGSKTEDEENMKLKSTWGGVTGWYLAVGAMVFNFMALFFIIIARSAAKRAREPGVDEGFEEEGEIKTMVLLDEKEEDEKPPEPEPEGQIVECPKCNYLLRVRTPERPVTIRCPNCKVIGDLK
jgi:hypothetical protein